MASGFNPERSASLQRRIENGAGHIQRQPSAMSRSFQTSQFAVSGASAAPFWVRCRSRLMARTRADVQRVASRAVGDLMPARGAVSHDERLGSLCARPEQRQLAHRHRDPVGVGAIAEGAGHAAATRFDRSRPQGRERASACSTGLNAPNDFWWQCPCTTAFGAMGAERQIQAPRLRLRAPRILRAGGRCPPTGFASSSGPHGEEFVAQASGGSSAPGR